MAKRSKASHGRRGLRKLSPELIAQAQDQTAATMSRIMLTFVGLALFCLLSLLTQDAALLTGGERLNVPFAGPVSFRAYLYGAQLMGANLFRADLEGANLEGARLTNFEYGGPANLEGANLEGANLEGAMNLIQMQVDRTCGDETTKLPEELSIRQCAK